MGGLRGSMAPFFEYGPITIANGEHDVFYLLTDVFVVIPFLIPNSGKFVPYGSFCYFFYLLCDSTFHLTGDKYPLAVLCAGVPFFYVVLAHLYNIYSRGSTLLFLVGLLSVVIPVVGAMQLWLGLPGVEKFFFCGPMASVNWDTTPFSQWCGADPLYYSMHTLAHCMLFLTGLIEIFVLGQPKLKV